MGQVWHQTLAAALAAAACLAASAASAASPGALGPTSRGSLTIRLTIIAPTRASGLADITFDSATAMADRELCLSGQARSYTVATRGSGVDGALTLARGDERIPYRVEWLRAAGPAAADAPVIIRGVTDQQKCAGATGSGRLRIALDSADAARLRTNARYTGALMLTVTPE